MPCVFPFLSMPVNHGFFPALGLQWGVGCSGDVKKAREVPPSLLLQRLPCCSLTLVGCFNMTLSAGRLSCGFFQDSPQDFLSRVVLTREGASSLYLVSYSFSFSPWEFSHSPLATFCWEPIISLAHPVRQNLKWPHFSVLLHIAPRKPSKTFCSSRWAG